MGKIFYATNSEKSVAMKLANYDASQYSKGVCYTPAKDSTCLFDETSKLWTCSATAHHQKGSCPRHLRGIEWEIGKAWKDDNNNNYYFPDGTIIKT